MNRRAALIYAVNSLMLAGVVICLFPFVQSLKPSEKVYAELPRIDIERMEAGSFKMIRHPRLGELRSGTYYSLLIIKNSAQNITAWILPTKAGRVLMPDNNWWQPIYECQDFRPVRDPSSGKEYREVKCLDPEAPEWWVDRWRWGVDGKNISGQAPDLEPAKGMVEQGYYVVGKSS